MNKANHLDNLMVSMQSQESGQSLRPSQLCRLRATAHKLRPKSLKTFKDIQGQYFLKMWRYVAVRIETVHT